MGFTCFYDTLDILLSGLLSGLNRFMLNYRRSGIRLQGQRKFIESPFVFKSRVSFAQKSCDHLVLE